MMENQERGNSLEDLKADPSMVKDLSLEKCLSMLIILASVQTLLLGRILSFNGKPELFQEDKLLNVEQAAERLGCNPDWLYRHSKKLPFTRRLSPRQLRFSSKGIKKYIQERCK